MHIRNINRDDSAEVKQLYELFRKAYTVEAQILGISPELFFPLQISLSDFRKLKDEMLGLYIDEVLSGAIFLEKNDSSITISNLIVDPKCFRRGIGYALINYAISKYETLDFVVGTGAKNTPAIKLYQKFDFQFLSEEIVVPDLKIVKFKRLACK